MNPLVRFDKWLEKQPMWIDVLLLAAMLLFLLVGWNRGLFQF